MKQKNVEKERIALNISREWYAKVFNEYVLEEYESLEVLKQYDTIRDGDIQAHMYTEVVRYYKPNAEELKKIVRENQKLCIECINKYRD